MDEWWQDILRGSNKRSFLALTGFGRYLVPFCLFIPDRYESRKKIALIIFPVACGCTSALFIASASACSLRTRWAHAPKPWRVQRSCWNWPITHCAPQRRMASTRWASPTKKHALFGLPYAPRTEHWGMFSRFLIATKIETLSEFQ